MNSLLPFDIKDTPEAIFRTPMGLSIEARIIGEFQSAAATKSPLDAKFKKRASHYPMVLADLLPEKDLIGEKDRSEILAHNTAALNTLLANFEGLSPILEERLLGNLEAVQQIYIHCMRSQDQGVTSPADLLARLHDDPNRLFDVTAHAEKKDLAQRLQRESEDMKLTSAGWAFFYLSSHLVDPRVPLETELIHVLQENEEYLYRAAHLLKFRRDALPFVWQPLVSKITSPRWVFHALRDSLADEREADFFKILYRAPQWCCELIASWDIEEVGADELTLHYKSMVSAAHNHELIQELHYWYRSMTTQKALAMREAV